MSDYLKITRVSIFLDYDNFVSSYCNKFKVAEDAIGVWSQLSSVFLSNYQNNIAKNDFELVEHVGTYCCVGLSEYRSNPEGRLRNWLKKLDCEAGFIVKYGHRTNPYKDKSGKWMLGKEKGVDSEIICQILMGAFLNHYDVCILGSDDADYVPVVHRVQDYFGKKIIQAGYQAGKLRECAYASIPLENADKNLVFFEH